MVQQLIVQLAQLDTLYYQIFVFPQTHVLHIQVVQEIVLNVKLDII
jgi:hypothetical protein